MNKTPQTYPTVLPHKLLHQPGLNREWPLPLIPQEIQQNKSHHCKCGEHADTINHYLTNCPLTQTERLELEHKFPNNLTDHKPEIIKDKSTYTALENLVKKITEITDQT